MRNKIKICDYFFVPLTWADVNHFLNDPNRGTGWEFTKLLTQIRKIFLNFKVLLQSSYS